MKKRQIRLDQEYYDLSWDKWDDMKSLGPSSRHVRRLTLKMIRGLKFRSLLDAGCGVGTLLADMHLHFPEVELSGVEYSSKGVSIARRRNPYASIRQMDLSQTALPQKFDLVTCIDVLEHIADDVSVLNNLHRMTAHHFLLVVPIGPLFEQEKINVGHVHGYSRKELKEKLSKAGFRVIKEMAWGFPFYTIYRRLIMNLPENATGGQFDWKKRLISKITYLILFLNLPFWGDRFFVLCHA